MENKSLPKLDLKEYENLGIATLAMGWFWQPDAQFGLAKGVKYTEVGYAGGNDDNPTYDNLGDHTETVQIYYDPNIIRFQDIMYMFFNSQTCPHLNTKQQYKSIVFYNNKDEKYIAQKIKTEVEFEKKKKIDVDIKPYKNFYAAEDYHQKYYFKRINKFFDEMKKIYPNIKDICKSTAVGHINGYVHGYGNIEKLMSEIKYLGLSKESQDILIKFVEKIWSVEL